MNPLLQWTLVYSVICIMKNVCCQYTGPYDGARCSPPSEDLFCEIPKELSNSASAKNQIMNTLLTVAASNGVLPTVADNLSTTQDLFASSTITSPTITNPYLGQIQYQNVPEYSQGYIPQAMPPLPTEISPQNHFCNPDFVTFPTYQLPQIQDLPCDTYKYLTSIPTPQSDIPPPTTLKTNYSPTVTSPNIVQDNGAPSYKQPAVVTCDSEFIPPFNIEINVPVPQLPEQILTLLSNDQSSSARNSNSNTPSVEAPLPIIISKGKSRSSLKKLLPILLLAMMLDDNDGCCGCSGRDSDANFIPIPYPIPIPVNNPFICLDKSKYNSAESESHEDDT